MKKFKKLLACLLAVLCTFSFDYSVSNATELEYAYRDNYENAAQLCEICWNAYNRGTYGPIIICQGQLTKDGQSTDVYLVTLAGTEFVENQATGVLQDIIAAFQSENNEYTQNVIAAIKKDIPTGSNLMLAGHSLGGMVAQLVAANSSIKANYNILNTITWGAPVIKGGSREGTVKRLGDVSDFVPYLSVTGQIIRQVAGLNREDGGYSDDGWSIKKAWNCHCNCYVREDEWGAYDVTGVKNGNATLSIDQSTIIYEHSDKTWTAMFKSILGSN